VIGAFGEVWSARRGHDVTILSIKGTTDDDEGQLNCHFPIPRMPFRYLSDVENATQSTGCATLVNSR
jgi:predicted transcriptional regulator